MVQREAFHDLFVKISILFIEIFSAKDPQCYSQLIPSLNLKTEYDEKENTYTWELIKLLF